LCLYLRCRVSFSSNLHLSSHNSLPFLFQNSPRSTQAQVHPAEVSGHSHAPIGSGVTSANQVGYLPESTAAQTQASNLHAKQQQHSTNNSSAQSAAATAVAVAAANQSSKQNMNLESSTSGGVKKSKDEYTQEAQQIVNEEREASEKMPHHEGLSERFDLISKMGE